MNRLHGPISLLHTKPIRPICAHFHIKSRSLPSSLFFFSSSSLSLSLIRPSAHPFSSSLHCLCLLITLSIHQPCSTKNKILDSHACHPYSACLPNLTPPKHRLSSVSSNGAPISISRLNICLVHSAEAAVSAAATPLRPTP